MEVSGQLHGPAALTPGKRSWYHLDRRVVGHQSRSGRSGVEENSQPITGLEPPIIQDVAQRWTTELSWILSGYTGKKRNLCLCWEKNRSSSP
jgi:hypothetical protein